MNKTDPCQESLYDVATGKSLAALPLTGIRPNFSSEGQWVVAAGTLLHLPSGDVRVLDPLATVALAT